MSSQTQSTPNSLRIGVIGCGDHAVWAVRQIRAYLGFCAVLSERGLDQQWSDATPGVLATAKQLECPWLDVSRADDGIEFFQSQRVDVLVLAGTRWILSSDFIDAFPGKIINLHPSKLPNHRGAGVFSWQILNGVRESTLSAYVVEHGIDDGPVLFQLTDDQAERLETPKQFIESHQRLFLKAIDRIIELAMNGTLLSANTPSVQQPSLESSYFPLLKTAFNGAIDWQWKLADIDAFIRAFGPPYPGAFSFHRGQRFSIEKATPLACQSMHPFCFGLVIRHMPDGAAHIACDGGILSIHQLMVNDALVLASDFLRLGGRVWTSADVLDQARIHRPTNRINH